MTIFPTQTNIHHPRLSSTTSTAIDDGGDFSRAVPGSLTSSVGMALV
jgi:hypothetical protein